MLKIDGIVTFVTVAEAGSISEAARRLRLSKSVVSERLSEMEKALGATLLHRTTRKLTLTEDGAAFLQRATRIAQEVREAAADLAERRGTLIGPLRIAAPVTFGRLHLGPALYPFLAEHPEIELTLDLDDRRVDAASDGYDAIIRHGLIADSRLVAWNLARSRRLLVASPDYLSRHGKPASLSDLEDHRGIFLHQSRRCGLAFRGTGRRSRHPCEAGIGCQQRRYPPRCRDCRTWYRLVAGLYSRTIGEGRSAC